jgi:UDPglucose--hexose-1-phosphate uridylyltransferase
VQELLVDELSGDRVILAPGRALRPDMFRVAGEQQPPIDAGCPFCDGNEHETPPEVTRLGPGAPQEPGWRVRVVPNKFPIVGDGVAGAHEVIVLSPAHDADLGRLSAVAATDVLLALRDRARFHLDQGLAYAQPFVNRGKDAGASIRHPHAQLVALDFVPPRVEARMKAFTREAFARDQAHVVASAGGVTVWCPRASTSPFLIRVALADGGARFDEIDDDRARAIASALRDTIARVHDVLGEPAYNVVFETAPPDADGPFQWWVDVVPRLGVMAGFELGTGVWVNVVPPADAAAALRDASVA